MKTILDLGEAGWAVLHRAHLHWREEQEVITPVQVFTLPDRVRFFIDTRAVKISCDLPSEVLSPSVVRNSFLYNDGPPIADVIRKLKIRPDEIIHGWENQDWKSDECYRGKMIFHPFKPLESEVSLYYNRLCDNDINRQRKNIVIFPRVKLGADYLEFRNWSKSHWTELYNLLLEKTDLNILFCGKYGEAIFFKEVRGRSVNLIDANRPLESAIAALSDPNTVLGVSSQGFGGKLILLQNKNLVSWGHQKERHAVLENWSSDPKVKCCFLEDMTYSLPAQTIFEEILKVIDEFKE